MLQAGRRSVASDMTLGHFAPQLYSFGATPLGPSGQSKTDSSTSPLKPSTGLSDTVTQDQSSQQPEAGAYPPPSEPALPLLSVPPSSAAAASAVSQVHPLAAPHTSAQLHLPMQAGPDGHEQGFQQLEAAHCVSLGTLAKGARPNPGLLVHSSGQSESAAPAPSAATITSLDSRYLQSFVQACNLHKAHPLLLLLSLLQIHSWSLGPQITLI